MSIAIRHQPDTNTIAIAVNGQDRTVFRYGGQYLKPHFWPIIGPFGGAVTRGFPNQPDAPDEERDHKHHRGLHFTHGELSFDGEPFVDFWAEDAKVQGRIVVRSIDPAPAMSNGAARFGVHSEWVAPDGRVMLRDHTRWSVAEAPGDGLLFAVRIALSAGQAAVTFGDTKEGSFAIRVPTSMDEQASTTGPRTKGPRGLITASDGRTTEKQCWGARADWVDYAGLVGGQRVGVAIFDHPDNRPRARWHVRGYGLFSANPFGSRAFNAGNPPHALRLEPGRSLILRYGVLVHAGATADADVAGRFAEYLRSAL